MMEKRNLHELGERGEAMFHSFVNFFDFFK